MGYILFQLIALALGACSLTAEDREAYRETGLRTAMLAVEALESVGIAPEDVDPKILRWANAACQLLDAGSPLIVQAINNIVARHNADRASEDQTDPVSIEEFIAGLHGVCEIIEAVLAPDESPADATEV